MNSLFARASLKRSPRTRTRKNSISTGSDTGCPPSRSSSTTTRQKTRPLPLQIIPELSEHELDLDISPTPSPTTARPTLTISSQPEPSKPSPRVTLSAYTFSIDDALLMFSDEAPGSPALSASSSTSGSASSEEVPTTPGTSDDEGIYDLMVPTPRLRPQRVSIHPLCITKTRSFFCFEDEDIHEILDREEKKVTPPVVVPVGQPKENPEVEVLAETTEEDELDFYAREFQDFISLYSVASVPSSPARRDSITITREALPTITEAPEPTPRGRSRHSKPLPLIPPITPSLSTFPTLPTFPLVQTTAQRSVVRRKRNIPPLPKYPPPPPPVIELRPPPRMAVPDDIEFLDFTEDDFELPSRAPIVLEQVYDDKEEEDASVYSQPSFTSTRVNSVLLGPALPETPIPDMHGDVCLPRSSTDSDAPRSSIDSIASSGSSSSAHSPISPFSFPSTPSSSSHGDKYEYAQPHPLRSRWSTSTIGSLAVEPPRTANLLSPLKSVFGSRSRRAPVNTTSPHASRGQPLRMHLRTPSKLPLDTRLFPVTPSPPSTPGKQVRRRGSRSSTSSAGTSLWGSSSECDSCDGSPNGLRRKPIPVEMFLRA
ncbi:hypothetical protein PAXRUDRAFT_831136 [Paxillus rubicundulus Ve08.2h10]|uniref:Uncharacterized protein n=1 Tax=Paxillus rubicundulus Ve08.2h10 TaxID=930991 RepID=A0A0D0DXI8_9AGAM|nr:hypothetical protein PAXRUDRAFT_831136 [Paxillus rubicundulus Ve08.2h10]